MRAFARASALLICVVPFWAGIEAADAVVFPGTHKPQCEVSVFTKRVFIFHMPKNVDAESSICCLFSFQGGQWTVWTDGKAYCPIRTDRSFTERLIWGVGFFEFPVQRQFSYVNIGPPSCFIGRRCSHIIDYDTITASDTSDGGVNARIAYISAQLPDRRILSTDNELVGSPTQGYGRRSENDGEYRNQYSCYCGDCSLSLVSEIAGARDIHVESFDDAEDSGAVMVKSFVSAIVLGLIYAVTKWLRRTNDPKDKRHTCERKNSWGQYS
jgi:hypothetical protein